MKITIEVSARRSREGLSHLRQAMRAVRHSLPVSLTVKKSDPVEREDINVPIMERIKGYSPNREV